MEPVDRMLEQQDRDDESWFRYWGEFCDEDDIRTHSERCTCEHCIQNYPERDPGSWEAWEDDDNPYDMNDIYPAGVGL